MTLPPFDLHRPTSEEEARELLLRYGDDAAALCGGTELLLLLKLGYAAYGHLVAISGIPTLRGVQESLFPIDRRVIVQMKIELDHAFALQGSAFHIYEHVRALRRLKELWQKLYEASGAASE